MAKKRGPKSLAHGISREEREVVRIVTRERRRAAKIVRKHAEKTCDCCPDFYQDDCTDRCVNEILGRRT